MSRYEGERTLKGSLVSVDGAPLPERKDIAEWSRTGFEWGFTGAAPRQLALALVAHHTGDPARALAVADPFMTAVVARLDNEWELDSDEIASALAELSG